MRESNSAKMRQVSSEARLFKMVEKLIDKYHENTPLEFESFAWPNMSFIGDSPDGDTIDIFADVRTPDFPEVFAGRPVSIARLHRSIKAITVNGDLWISVCEWPSR